MLKGKVRWALTTGIVCAGLWCFLTPRILDAASGGKNIEITVLDANGKPLSGAHVEFLRPGGKPFEAIMVEKNVWVIKNADDKVTVSVRDGRAGGLIEVPGPAGDLDLASYKVTVTATGLRVDASDNVAAPPAPTKPEINVEQLRHSTHSTFSEANRSALRKGDSAGLGNSNIPVKDMVMMAPPANDLCADAISVSLPSVTVGTTVEATVDAGLPSCGTSVTAGGVWYTFVGNGTQVTVDTCSSTPYDSKVTVFSGSCGSFTCVGGVDDTSGCGGGDDARVGPFCATQGVTYYVLVHGFSAQTGSFSLNITSGASCAPPANDLCVNAQPVGPLPASVNVDNSFATNDTLATCGSSPHNKTTWFSVVGDGTTYTATTCNLGTTVSDTELIVYCRDCADPLCVGGDDDGCPATPPGTLKSTFSWCTEPGATYLIAVGNFSATLVGNINLEVSSDGVPACQGAVSCLVVTGACCVAGTCTGTTQQADCLGAGGTWYVNQSCPAFACPGDCAGETCASAATISSLPFNGTGNTCDCANDYDSVCPFTGSTSRDAVYSYTPAQNQCVSVSLCNGSNYDTKVYVFANDCTTPAIACNDDSCTSPNFPSPYVSRLDFVSLTAGTTYYFVVDGYGGECGNYVLDITPVACPPPCGVCPGGAIQENEPNCGLPTDTVNGGCNSAPPVFSSISCGQDVCGTSAWDGSSRDTDWYQVTFATDTEFTWTVQAEFPVVIGMVLTSPLGNPDCNTAVSLDPFAVGASCGLASVTRCVPPGTYWLFVAPDFNGPTFACGADYTARLDCEGCTPPSCVGDTCDTAEVIASLPFSDSGDTCICNDNYDEICPYNSPGSPDKVFKYTPTEDECVDISLCAGSNYDTKVYVYQSTCGAYQSGSYLACNDDECTSPNYGAPYVSELTGVNLLAGQDYYIVVDGYAGFGEGCGTYTIDIGPCAPPCDIECSPGATPENELNCGIPTDTVNGGCNSDPAVFTPLTCEQSYCGTSAFDEGVGLRDTDWYRVTVGSSTRFTWSAHSEFLSLTGLVPTSPAGTGNCSDLVGVVDPALFGDECTPAQVVTECLPAGTYIFFMAPTFDDPVACGKQYEVGLSCEPCVIPLGACCRPDGSCEDGIAQAACQNWQGADTLCANVSCPQPPPNDLCDNAIPVAIPSVTAGSTQLSTFDTGLPATCGTSITTAGVWYSLIGNGNTITIDTCSGTTYDSKISVFCPNCSAPACVTGNDDSCGLQSTVSFCTAVGETYLILVHGFGGATGPFQLTVTNGPACSTPPSCEVVGICGGGGDCCVPGTGPGCNDVACCETVCACDSFCCDVVWDEFCAGEGFAGGCGAAILCNCGGGSLTGACCRGSACTIETMADCQGNGGIYLGDNTSCTGPDIPGNSYVIPTDEPIPDGPGGVLVDTFNVPDTFSIADLNVDLVINHTWVGDLVVTIEHNGTSVTIVDRPGYAGSGFGCGSDNLNIILDDEGQGGPVETQCVANLTSPPNYVPNNPLSAFDGMNGSGLWTITVTDSEGFDTGSLIQWSLHFGEPGGSVCAPSGACCLSPTTCIVTAPEDCNGTYLGDGTNCSAAGPVSTYSASPGLPIPDAPASPPGAVGAPLSHTINVPDSYTVADVNVDLDILHTWVGDLIVTVAHNSTTVTIIDRAGYAGTGFGCGSDNYDVVIDDQGTGGAIESLCGPTLTPTSPPNYTPNNPLSVFNGMDSSGDWTITITDNANLDTGSLAAWALHITRPGEGPCSGLAVCGNGTVESGEECDDGNASNNDACLNDCTSASCGDGFVQTGVEECDDGNNVNEDSCTNSCTLAECGDGFVQPGEQCDDGNGINTDACTNACTIARCGDGIVRGGFEQCDDGNLVDDDGCTNACTLPVCGDGIVQDGEECDGTNAEACDGVCLDDCTCELTAIPTMSEWGLAVLALCLLIGAKLYFGRREVTA